MLIIHTYNYTLYICPIHWTQSVQKTTLARLYTTYYVSTFSVVVPLTMVKSGSPKTLRWPCYMSKREKQTYIILLNTLNYQYIWSKTSFMIWGRIWRCWIRHNMVWKSKRPPELSYSRSLTQKHMRAMHSGCCKIPPEWLYHRNIPCSDENDQVFDRKKNAADGKEVCLKLKRCWCAVGSCQLLQSGEGW